MIINLQHETSKAVKQCKVGFSWTTLFFGFFPALFRGDWKWALIMFFSSMIIGAITIGIGGFGGGLIPIIFAFLYNKLYIKDLLESGYKPNDQNSYDILRSKGIITY